MLRSTLALAATVLLVAQTSTGQKMLVKSNTPALMPRSEFVPHKGYRIVADQQKWSTACAHGTTHEFACLSLTVPGPNGYYNADPVDDLAVFSADGKSLAVKCQVSHDGKGAVVIASDFGKGDEDWTILMVGREDKETFCEVATYADNGRWTHSLKTAETFAWPPSQVE
ncbi:hypothetical protein BCV70DRAFT_232120 [Testicularia cyperi]|uniref:Uncharacterized protein n=1 Tax=Testicularia cyperi TaxID=1882483 RepID=A0A317XPJ1_9BASI|nr:hypothetical protein BCV70DRAFT_232120 [Testicularia cyperi]